jgi:hypothetical protein
MQVTTMEERPPHLLFETEHCSCELIRLTSQLNLFVCGGAQRAAAGAAIVAVVAIVEVHLFYFFSGIILVANEIEQVD